MSWFLLMNHINYKKIKGLGHVKYYRDKVIERY